MKRYMLRLSYIGTSYRGSQKHCNNKVLDIDSVQGSIETALLKLGPCITEYPNVVLAGRTDAGVHALYTAAHFDLQHKYGESFDTDNVLRMMNRYLISCGHEIRILTCQEVSNKFHARFSAKSRTYLYRFFIPKHEHDHRIPIAESGRSMHLHASPSEFSIEKFVKGLELFKGKRDFTTFSSKVLNKKIDADKLIKHYIRTVDINLEESTPLMPFDPHSKNFTYWNITFKSRSFLYNQIRRMVGALFALGLNKISEDDLLTMLQVPSHNNWNPKSIPAQPHGLYLLNVEYNDADLQPICIQ